MRAAGARGRARARGAGWRGGGAGAGRGAAAAAAAAGPGGGPAPKKVVLAYSGGLDTSIILKWLQNEYGCEVVTFTADLGQVRRPPRPFPPFFPSARSRVRSAASPGGSSP